MVRYLRSVVVSAGFIGLIALFSGGCPAQAPPVVPPQPGGDDDRPPIIVSDGSVHFRVVAKNRGLGANKDRGSWKKDSAGMWFLDHNNEPATYLLVNVIHGTTGTSCDDPEHDFKVRELTITYAGTKTIHVYLDPVADATKPSPVKVDVTGATAAAADTKVPFWLDVGAAGDHLVSVTFPSLSTTCTFDQGGLGQVQIYERIK